MRGQTGTRAITWPVIDTGNLGGLREMSTRGRPPYCSSTESYGRGSGSRDSSRSFARKSAAALLLLLLFLFFIFFLLLQYFESLMFKEPKSGSLFLI